MKAGKYYFLLFPLCFIFAELALKGEHRLLVAALSVCPSVCPSVYPKPFLHNPGPNWTKLHTLTSWDIMLMHSSWFFSLTLCHGNRAEFLVKFQFLLTSHSVFVKISLNFIVILFIKSFTMCSFFLSMCFSFDTLSWT